MADMMNKVLAVHAEIYDEFDRSAGGPKFFFGSANEDRFAASYTSMYLIADTAEAGLAFPVIPGAEIIGITARSK
jgi:hypothetical protein